MSQTYDIKKWVQVGAYAPEGALAITKRSVSYTPANAMTIRQWSAIIARKQVPRESPNNTDTFEWEIRSPASAGGHSPQPGDGGLLASGSFDWRETGQFGGGKFIKFTALLSEGLELEAGTEYWFGFSSPLSAYNLRYPLHWALAETADTNVYMSTHTTSGWSEGTNSENPVLYILDAQAGVNWHCVVNDLGYMQPDKMRGWSKQTVASGLAQTRGGQSEHSQMRYPYSSESQDSWSSGMGQVVMDDQKAFLYSKTMDTTVEDQAIIGPAMHVVGAETDNVEHDPTDIMAMEFPYPWRARQTVPGINEYERYEAQMFTPGADIAVTHIGVRARRNAFASDSLYNMYLSVWSNSATGGDHPDTQISVPVTPLGVVYPGLEFEWVDCDIESLSLTNGTKYWLVVYTDQYAGEQPKFELMFDTEGTFSGGSAYFSYETEPDAATDWIENTTPRDDKAHSLSFRLNWGEAGGLDGTVTDFAYGPVGETTGFYCLAGRKVYQWDETNGHWDDISTGITASVGKSGAELNELEADGTDIIIYNKKLVVCQGYGYPMRIWDGTTWTYAGTADVVSNGSFDATVVGWTAVRATVTSETGGHSGKCMQIVAVDSGAAGTYAIAHQTITVTPETWYTLEFYHKNGTNNDADRVLVGHAISGMEYYDSGNGAMNDATWTKRTAVFKTDPAITSLVITLVGSDNDSTETSFYDEVKLFTTSVGKYLHIGKGYLWVSSSTNGVKRSSTLATWTGYADDDGNVSEITIGDNSYEITAMALYSGRFLVGKEDGIWEVDTTTGLATEYLVFREHAASTNCKGMCVWSGMLFIPVQSSLWRWQGSQYKEAGPTDMRSGPTRDWPCSITALAPTAPLLFASADPAVSSGFGGIMAYNGMGWHAVATASQNNKSNKAICVTTALGAETRIWVGQGEKVGYIRICNYTHNRYDWEGVDYDISGGYLVTSQMNGGLKDAHKFWRSVCLMADVPAYTYIDVFALADGEEWSTTSDMVFLGRVTNDTFTDNNEFVLMFPDGTVAKSMQLVFYLWSEVAGRTPRLKAFNLETLVRQKVVYAYSFRILIADNITKLDKTGLTERTAETLVEELERAERSEIPITVSFPDNTFRGVISNQREEVLQYAPDGMNKERWERTVVLSVIEAT